jgi:hypothetical protein
MKKEEKDGRLKLWSAKRSDNKGREGRKAEVVECGGEEE